MNFETRQCQALRSGCRPALDRLLQLVVGACDVPAAVVSLTHDDNQVVIACRGIGALQVGAPSPLTVSMSGSAAVSGLPSIVEDIDFYERSAYTWKVREYGLRSYAAFPVRDDDGEVIATLAVAAPWPRSWCTAELQAVDTATQLLGDLLKAYRVTPFAT